MSTGSASSGGRSFPAAVAGQNKAHGPRTAEDEPDLFEAIDESFQKVVKQSLKPLNTLAYAVQDMEAMLGGKSSGESADDMDQELSRRYRVFEFRVLRDVKQSPSQNGVLQLEDHDAQ